MERCAVKRAEFGSRLMRCAHLGDRGHARVIGETGTEPEGPLALARPDARTGMASLP